MTTDHHADAGRRWALGADLVDAPIAAELISTCPHPLAGKRDALSRPQQERSRVPGGSLERQRGGVPDDRLAGGRARDYLALPGSAWGGPRLPPYAELARPARAAVWISTGGRATARGCLL